MMSYVDVCSDDGLETDAACAAAAAAADEGDEDDEGEDEVGMNMNDGSTVEDLRPSHDPPTWK